MWRGAILVHVHGMIPQALYSQINILAIFKPYQEFCVIFQKMYTTVYIKYHELVSTIAVWELNYYTVNIVFRSSSGTG